MAKRNNNYNYYKRPHGAGRVKEIEGSFPFIALIGGVAALVGLLIWIIEILK